MWIKTKDQLPPAGKYVLARHNRGTWIDKSDPKNVNCVVVKLVKGISQEERRLMRENKLKSKGEMGWCLSDGWKSSPRWIIEKQEDQAGNNLVPYCWSQFGPDNFFGQEIEEWQPIED